jgi:hypothetical protein
MVLGEGLSTSNVFKGTELFQRPWQNKSESLQSGIALCKSLRRGVVLPGLPRSRRCGSEQPESAVQEVFIEVQAIQDGILYAFYVVCEGQLGVHFAALFLIIPDEDSDTERQYE